MIRTEAEYQESVVLLREQQGRLQKKEAKLLTTHTAEEVARGMAAEKTFTKDPLRSIASRTSIASSESRIFRYFDEVS